MGRGLGELQKKILKVLVENTESEEDRDSFFEKWGCEGLLDFFSKYYPKTFNEKPHEAWLEHEKQKPVFMERKEVIRLLGFDNKSNKVKATVSRAIKTLSNRGLVKGGKYHNITATLRGRQLLRG